MKTIQKSIYVFMMACLLIVAGCSSDDNNDQDSINPGPLTEGEVHQIEVMLVEIIRDSGRDFPQYDQNRPFQTNNLDDLDDFLEGPNNYMETINEPGALKIRLWLDDEGNIIPSPTWQQNNPNYCSEEGLYMRPARKLLEFKVLYDPDFGLNHPDQFAYGVQLNLIDVETSTINESVWVDPIIDEANNWINATLNEAWNQMLGLTTIHGAMGPCEGEIQGEIQLSLYFNSEMTTEIIDEDGSITYFEDVETTVDLVFDENKGTYVGVAPLDWTASYVMIPGEGTFPAPPYDADLHILGVVTPAMASNNPELEPIMYMIFHGDILSPLVTLAWTALYESEDIPEARYIVPDWEILPAGSSIIMRKVNNRTVNLDVDGDQVILIEKTTIEIRQI